MQTVCGATTIPVPEASMDKYEFPLVGPPKGGSRYWETHNNTQVPQIL